VIDLSSFEVVNTIPVSANPQYIVEKDGMLHVSCTGNWIDTFGKVCIVSPVTETVVQTLDIGGSLNSIWVKNTEQAFVADGNGINLYQYNPETSSIINGATNPITPGGSVVWGNENLVALLCPNWGSTGKLRVLHPDLSFWNEYALGMAPTDMKFEQTNTQSSDETNVPTLSVTVYPNPVLQGQDLTFSFGKAINGTIRLYNTKGQLVASKPFNSDKAGVSSSDLISHLSDGIYFYAVEAGKTRTTGKVIIIR